MTHHPNSKALAGWEREYAKIIKRYENVVATTLVGHTHQDEAEVLYVTHKKTKPLLSWSS